MSINPVLKQCQKKIPGYLAILFAVMWIAGPACADGMSDPQEARALCDKWGKSDTPSNLKACCSNLILVESMKEQKKLEAECAAGEGVNKAEKRTVSPY